MNHCGQCGTAVAQPFDDLGCFVCGAGCCPSCAIALESTAFCRPCAVTLLEVGTVRSAGPFELR
jgi:hypothetical protein